jgi:hypothetical protein
MLFCFYYHMHAGYELELKQFTCKQHFYVEHKIVVTMSM